MTPTESAAGAATGGSAAQNTGADVASTLAQVAAALAGVTTSLNEVTNKVNAIESRVKQTSANDDTNFETSVTGVHDPFDDVRRSAQARDRIAAYAEQALANCVEVAHRCALQGLDHSAALPPIAPRAPTGPGTTGG